MNNALEFASRNFDVDQERNYIMQVICEACTQGSDEVKEYAYQCLSRIAEVPLLAVEGTRKVLSFRQYAY